jgi:hypothetical protein
MLCSIRVRGLPTLALCQEYASVHILLIYGTVCYSAGVRGIYATVPPQPRVSVSASLRAAAQVIHYRMKATHARAGKHLKSASISTQL